VFHLHAFGGLRLATGDRNDSDVPLQKLCLAVLAVLAVSAPRPLSREKLMTLLWPEVDEPRAGHRLTQLRYELRKALRVDPIAGTTELRLNASVITTDLQLFREALERNDLEGAARIAEAPLFDGLLLRDNIDFNNWIEEVRREFDRQIQGALDRLAKSAEARGDALAAARWLESLVRRDPTDENAAFRAVNSYEASGEHAQARRFGEWLQRVLRDGCHWFNLSQPLPGA
jgi:DNA-binding SARP family transcriptional activator